MNYEKFLPTANAHGNTAEAPEAYAERMKSTLLPNWPTELLIEWLHRYDHGMAKYCFLGFETLEFEKVTWKLRDVPGVEVYGDPRCFDDYRDIDHDASIRANWLPRYMKEHGTWKAAIILLKNDGEIVAPDGFGPLRSPFHLIEGRRRLSYLNTLRERGEAKGEHDVWLVKADGQKA